MHRRRNRGTLALTAGLALALGLSAWSAPLASAGGAPLPSIELVTARSAFTVTRAPGHAARFGTGEWVAAVGGDFQLNVSRPDYDTPVGLTQVDSSDGSVLQTLPSDLLVGPWYGLSDFVHVTVRGPAGTVIDRRAYDWCPNSWDRQRVDDSGPMTPTYPTYCGGMPLTMGTVWGIDQGWAVSPFGYGGSVRISGPDGDYTVTTRIRPTYRTLFGIENALAESTVTVTVETSSTHTSQRPQGRTAAPALPEVPIDTNPDPSTIPDLQALPSWGIGVYHRRGKDFLAFGATAWDAGPQQMTVEGFRQPDADTMDAFQYFFDADGNAVGKAPVGTMEFDTRTGHEHWHFEQFAQYDLLDGTQAQVVRSRKQSFCLAPTDPVDLTKPGAEMDPYQIGLYSQCGGPDALWIREDLPAGWGDTYFQFVGGQAFDVTDLPNGKYFIQVTVNPLGAIYETDTTNDTSLRRVLLRGQPGDRRVVVPPYHGIDTENWCYYCGPF